MPIHLHLITRLRNNNRLRYAYLRLVCSGPGHSTQYAAKPEVTQSALPYLWSCLLKKDMTVYKAWLTYKALQGRVKIGSKHSNNQKGEVNPHQLPASAPAALLPAPRLWSCYYTRFLLDFFYR